MSNGQKEYHIALSLEAPNPEYAKRVADEAQALIDRFGPDTFLRAVEFLKNNPQMVNMALGMINSR